MMASVISLMIIIMMVQITLLKRKCILSCFVKIKVKGLTTREVNSNQIMLNRKLHGLHGISAMLIRECTDLIFFPICVIFDRSLSLEYSLTSGKAPELPHFSNKEVAWPS